MDINRRLEYSVTLVGFFLVAGILYETFSSPIDVPSGYLAAYGVTSCCLDCSCDAQQICSSCQKCAWIEKCDPLSGTLTPGGLELRHSGRARDNSTYLLNAVIYPKEDGIMLVDLALPAGFSAERTSAVVDLYAGEARVVPFTMYIRENVAEQDHILRVELIDSDYKVISSSEAKVSVYWER